MKKAILSISLFLSSLLASAQWQVSKSEGDELLGTTPTTTIYYLKDHCCFSYIQNNDEFFQISTDIGMFDYHPASYIFRSVIGFYNENKTLINKYDDFLLITMPGKTQTAYSNKTAKLGGTQKKKIKRLIDFIRNEKGYVRIVAPIYGKNQQFDLTMPCLQNENN